MWALFFMMEIYDRIPIFAESALLPTLFFFSLLIPPWQKGWSVLYHAIDWDWIGGYALRVVTQKKRNKTSNYDYIETQASPDQAFVVPMGAKT
jgi:hypothetical protein